MMSISTGARVHFWICLLDRESFGHGTWPTDIVMGNIFKKCHLQALWKPFLPTQRNKSKTHYDKIVVFSVFVEEYYEDQKKKQI